MTVKEAVISIVASYRVRKEISPLDVVQLYDSMADALITCFGAIAANKRAFVIFYDKMRKFDREGGTKPPAAIEFDYLIKTLQSEMQDLDELVQLPKKMGVKWSGDLPLLIRDMPIVAKATFNDLDTMTRVLRNSDSMRDFPTAPMFFDIFRAKVIDLFIADVKVHMAHLASAGVPEAQRNAIQRPVSKVLALKL